MNPIDRPWYDALMRCRSEKRDLEAEVTKLKKLLQREYARSRIRAKGIEQWYRQTMYFDKYCRYRGGDHSKTPSAQAQGRGT